MPLKDKFIQLLSTGVRVVKEENSIIALYKPNIVLSHPNIEKKNENTLLHNCKYNHKGEFYEYGDEKYYLLNRLDSATNGLLLMSDNASLAKEIKLSFAKRNIYKSYLAKVFVTKLVKERFKEQWIDSLSIENINNKVRSRIITNIVDSKHYPKAKTNIERQYNNSNEKDTIILKIGPLTGYTHQIRVQSAHHGFPIVGDRLYGNFSMNNRYFKSNKIKDKKLFLTACEYRVPYLFNGVNSTFHVKIDVDKETFNPVNM